MKTMRILLHIWIIRNMLTSFNVCLSVNMTHIFISKLTQLTYIRLFKEIIAFVELEGVVGHW